MTVTKVRRKRRRLKRWVKMGIAILIAITFVVLVFTTFIPLIDQIRLTKKGYCKESAISIRSQKLSKEVLSREYSENFDINMKQGIIVNDNIEIYYVTTDVDESDLHLYDILLKQGYSEEDVLKVFGQLTYQEITPLTVYNNVTNIDDYINDVVAYRVRDDIFIYDLANYTNFYDNIINVKDPSALDVIVNKYNKLPDDYVPNNLVECSVRYAAKGVRVKEELYEAFKEMVEAMNNEGLKGLYISSGYRSYDTQTSLYKSYYRKYSKDYADAYSARASHSEHQTGLAVDLTASGYESAGFVNSPHSDWMIENSYKYGFILRYTDAYVDKEHSAGLYPINTVTGYSYEPWHFRYIGKELATKVYESKLTYDEYYELYIREY